MPELSEEHTLGASAGGKWTLAEGKVLGGYRVIRPLGRGGMGEVYLVEHIEMGKRYAMKVLSPEHSRDPEFRDRFRVEARLMADLEHPGIVRVHNMGEERDRFFLIMDYVEASSGGPVTLDALMRKRELREDEVRSLAAGIARALEYAHTFGEGVVHRDLKPGNVLLGADGRVRVSDFGLAKVLGEEYLKSVLEKSVSLSVSAARTGEVSPGLTQSDGAVLGTFEYMAPEQKEGRADARSDIYSLGLVIYRMLTGRRAEGRFPDPSKLGFAEWWDRVIEKSLAPDPDERYASAAELLTDLQRVEPEKKEAPPPSRPRFSRAMRVLVVALGAALTAVFALGIMSWYSVQPPPPPPPPPPTGLPPEVRFTRAPEGEVAPPSATLMLEIEASDDEGLREIGIVCVVRGKATRTVLSRPSRGTRRVKVKHALKLARLAQGRGETVTYYAYAVDDDAAGGPKETQSRARSVKIISPVAGDEAAWLAVKREAESRAARGDYAGALDCVRRYLDSAGTVEFKPQAVFLWGSIEQKKVEAEQQSAPAPQR